MHHYTKIMTTIGGIIGLCVLCVIFLQVTGRYLGLYNFPWTEEVARFLFMWCIAFFAGPLYLTASYIKIDFFVDMLSMQHSHLLQGVIHAMILVFSVIFTYAGYQLAQKTGVQISPAAGWKMAYVNFSACFLGGNLVLCSAVRLYQTIYNKGDMSC